MLSLWPHGQAYNGRWAKAASQCLTSPSSKAITTGFSHDVNGQQTLPVILYKTCPRQWHGEAATHFFSYCRQVKSLDLSREESMEGNSLLLKSHTRGSRERCGRSVLLQAQAGRWQWWISLQHTDRSMADTLYYLHYLPLPEYCSVQKIFIEVPNPGDLVPFGNILYHLSFFLKFISFVAAREVTEHLCAAS